MGGPPSRAIAAARLVLALCCLPPPAALAQTTDERKGPFEVGEDWFWISIVIGSYVALHFLNGAFVKLKKYLRRKAILKKIAESEITPEELEQLRMVSSFNETQVMWLYSRFKEMDQDDSGALTLEELVTLEEFEMNPLAHRLMKIMDENHDRHLAFEEFIAAMDIFHEGSPRERKLKTLFAIYDVNGDGRICRDDLFHILEKVTLMEEKLEKKKKKKKKKKDDDDSDDDSDSDSEEEKEDPLTVIQRLQDEHESFLKRVVEQVFEETSSDTMFITFEDFVKVVSQSDFEGRMTINLFNDG